AAQRASEPFAQRPPASCRTCLEAAGVRKSDLRNQTAAADIWARERFDVSQELRIRLASTDYECQQWKASSVRCAAPSSHSIPQTRRVVAKDDCTLLPTPEYAAGRAALDSGTLEVRPRCLQYR